MLSRFSKVLFNLSSNSHKLPALKEEQNKVLNKIIYDLRNIPESRYKKSYAQYLAHKKTRFGTSYFKLNVISFVALLPVSILLLMRNFFIAKKESQNLAIFNRLPQEIHDNYSPVKQETPFGSISLSDYIKLLKNLLQLSFAPYFLLRVLWKVATYSELIQKFSPHFMFVSQEMNFESSILTEYCETKQVTHVNVMHGDKFFYIKDSFCSFHIFYFWEQSYKELFLSLNASWESCVFFTPVSIRQIETSQAKEIPNLITYYSQINLDEQLFRKRMKNLLSFAKKNQLHPVVRFHPNHQADFEQKVLDQLGLSSQNASLSFSDSIKEAEYICSEYSSTLYEAYKLRKKIVIDNTISENIDRLDDLNYLMVKKKHLLLNY